MNEELTPVAARKGKIRVVVVTTSSVAFDLTLATEIIGDINDGRFMRLQADPAGDVYYAFDVVTGTIDKTNSTIANATQCDCIPAGQYRDVKIPYVPGLGSGTGLCSWLMVQGSAAGFLRISPSSESQKQRY